MSGQFHEDLDDRFQHTMLAVRLNVRSIAEDIADGYMQPTTKGDFIMRIRMALDDLDESELGAMYDEYVKDNDDSDDDD